MRKNLDGIEVGCASIYMVDNAESAVLRLQSGSPLGDGDAVLTAADGSTNRGAALLESLDAMRLPYFQARRVVLPTQHRTVCPPSFHGLLLLDPHRQRRRRGVCAHRGSESHGMLILGSDASKGGSAPWVTWSLIAVNVLAFLAQLATGNEITYGFSLVPREFTTGRDLVTSQRSLAPGLGRPRARRALRGPGRGRAPAPGPFPIQATLFSHMFLHAGWLHLLGNMWFLFVFGGHVERALRPGVFLTAYVVCGLAAGAAQVCLDPHSVLPCLGASGAISGVMGAYLFVHPFSTVRVWLWFFVFRLPAFVVLGFWLLTQFLGVAAASTPACLTAAWPTVRTSAASSPASASCSSCGCT